jgi:hypothetical protein
MKTPEIGDRIYVVTDFYSGYGEVTYIDYKNLYVNSSYPIQVTMEEPDSDGHYYTRVNLKEIKEETE